MSRDYIAWNIMILGGRKCTNIRSDFPQSVYCRLTARRFILGSSCKRYTSSHLYVKLLMRIAVVTSRHCAVHNSATGGRQGYVNVNRVTPEFCSGGEGIRHRHNGGGWLRRRITPRSGIETNFIASWLGDCRSENGLQFQPGEKNRQGEQQDRRPNIRGWRQQETIVVSL